MHYNRIIIILFVLGLFLSACEKKPKASFKTDKDEYMAGEVIKLTNTSEIGSGFEWLLPEGKSETTKDAEYTVNSNTGFDELSITLNAKSKHHCKRNTFTKTVRTYPLCYITWYNIPFSSNKTYVTPTVTSNSNASNYSVSALYESGAPYYDFYYFNFYFSPGSSPAAGTYTLQSGAASLPSNGAFISVYGGPLNSPSTTNFTVGQIQVEYINNVMHIYFTDAQTSPTYFKLAGSVYKR